MTPIADTNTLTTGPLAARLAQMHTEAEAPQTPEAAAALAAIPAAQRGALSLSPTRYREFYEAASQLYLAVSPETGRLLYILARSHAARSIVEYGTSFGISTLYLAAALRDNGGGRLITAEFEESKLARAAENFAAAGVADLIELRAGDALESLAGDLPERIDLVLLDGAKGLYPQILARLEPRLAPGSLIVADDADRSPEYLARVRDPDRGYLSVPFAADVEVSMRVG